MAETPPQFLTLKRNRDLEGLERRPWTRRVLLMLLGLLVVAGAANVFGQHPDTDVAEVPDDAELEVEGRRARLH